MKHKLSRLKPKKKRDLTIVDMLNTEHVELLASKWWTAAEFRAHGAY